MPHVSLTGCFVRGFIFNAFGGVMPQERLTIDYFLNRNLADKISTPVHLREIIGNWLEHPECYQKMKNDFGK